MSLTDIANIAKELLPPVRGFIRWLWGCQRPSKAAQVLECNIGRPLTPALRVDAVHDHMPVWAVCGDSCERAAESGHLDDHQSAFASWVSAGAAVAPGLSTRAI